MFSIEETIKEVIDLIKRFFYTFWSSMFYQKNLLDQLSSPNYKKPMKSNYFLIISILVLYFTRHINYLTSNNQTTEQSIQNFISNMESFSKQMSFLEFSIFIIPFLSLYYGLLWVLKKWFRFKSPDGYIFYELNKLYLGSWVVFISIFSITSAFLFRREPRYPQNDYTFIPLLLFFLSLIVSITNLIRFINKKNKLESVKMKLKMFSIPVLTFFCFILFFFYMYFFERTIRRGHENKNIIFTSIYNFSLLNRDIRYRSNSYYLEVNDSSYLDFTTFKKIFNDSKTSNLILKIPVKMFILVHNTTNKPLIIQKKSSISFEDSLTMSIEDKDTLTPFILVTPNEMKILKLSGIVNGWFFLYKLYKRDSFISVNFLSDHQVQDSCKLVFYYEKNPPQLSEYLRYKYWK
jgi:hypothetical protein